MSAALSTNVPTHCSGFKILPVKFSKTNDASHLLYFKPHVVDEPDPDRPPDRTIIVAGVPPFCDEECLDRLFSTCSPVEKIHIKEDPSDVTPTHTPHSRFFRHSKPLRGFKVAYVVFRSNAGVEKAREMQFNSPLKADLHESKTGMGKWCEEYRAAQMPVNPTLLQADINKYMELFDAEADKKKEEAKKADEEAEDEEGWTTVTRRGKRPGIPRTEKHEQRALKRLKKKNAQNELLNFYSHQMRSAKKEKIAELRKKFEEDKHTIALMKASRKFKPY